jgi:hypothetical protein
MRYRTAILIQYATRNDDALAYRFTCALSREIRILRLHPLATKHRTGQFGQRLWQQYQRLRR